MRIGWRVTTSLLVAAGVGAAAWGVGTLSGPLERDRAFQIGAFDQVVAISADGTTEVVEDIAVAFTQSRRGIFRDFDENTAFPSSGSYAVQAVERPGSATPWNYVVESGPTGPRVRIGDASVFLSPGPYLYQLRYTAPTWFYELEDDPGTVEIRIDSPGFDWPTRIGLSTLTVALPGEIRDAVCVEGPRRTTRPCATAPVVDGNRARFAFGPFDAREAATVALHVDRAAFDVAVPTYDATPLSSGGLFDPWPLSRAAAALLLALLVAAPIAAWEAVSAWYLYRDRVTDPALHDRRHPVAIPAPPHGLRPPEVAGLLLRKDADALLLSTLVDLDQRGDLTSTSETEEGRFFRKDKESLTVRQTDGIPIDGDDAAFARAVAPTGLETIFDGEYDATVASRVNAAKALVTGRADDVFEDHHFVHHHAGLVGRMWFRALVTIGILGFAALVGLVLVVMTPLHPVAAGIVGALVLVGWALARLPWRHHLVPLNSAGRDAVAQARSFHEFVRTVEGEQIEWASGQAGIDHHHPALSLLPYAIALGLAESWYGRFGSVMQELAVTAAGAAGVGAGTWWLSRNSFDSVSSSQSGTSTAPSSSGGGGGGGSGGGGGGGGSW